MFKELYKAAFTQPAIDNHAHPLLCAAKRDAILFEGVISEAEGEALVNYVPSTLACLRATKQLANLYGLENGNVTWQDVKLHRSTLDYDELCTLSFKESGIKHILVDDGLDGTKAMTEDYKWHEKFISGSAKRIVRIEFEAEAILSKLLGSQGLSVTPILEEFERQLRSKLSESGADPEVVGFKSIVCYRSGLNVSVMGSVEEKESAMRDVRQVFQTSGRVRLAYKALNDEVVRIGLEIAGKSGKPMQFHTGLGDNDMSLLLSSPAQLQPIIKAFPNAIFVLLHASYPYTREAGYLTAMYKNVYLDFGEVFPIVSGEGQRDVIRQVLELCPTDKIMWSSDGHWWPESYYLGILQARQALYEVIKDSILRNELTEVEGVTILEKALYSNAARLYHLVK